MQALPREERESQFGDIEHAITALIISYPNVMEMSENLQVDCVLCALLLCSSAAPIHFNGEGLHKTSSRWILFCYQDGAHLPFIQLGYNPIHTCASPIEFNGAYFSVDMLMIVMDRHIQA